MDTTDPCKDSKKTATKIIINSKACVQRNQDARVGQSPGSHGPNAETRPRSRSRSIQREPGPTEGRVQDSCQL